MHHRLPSHALSSLVLLAFVSACGPDPTESERPSGTSQDDASGGSVSTPSGGASGMSASGGMVGSGGAPATSTGGSTSPPASGGGTGGSGGAFGGATSSGGSSGSATGGSFGTDASGGVSTSGGTDPGGKGGSMGGSMGGKSSGMGGGPLGEGGMATGGSPAGGAEPGASGNGGMASGGADGGDPDTGEGGAPSMGGAGGGGGMAKACSTITEFGTVSQTIVVRAGETFDGQCRRYRADPNTLGDGSQSESQKPVFRIEDGGRLINVVLGSPAADGIHTYGDVVLENVVWEDIGEDALTIKESGTVTLDGGSARDGEDKVFQVNAPSTFRISNFRASNAGKFIRQNGGTTFKVDVFIDRCDISNMKESIFRTDSSTSTVTMTNTRYSKIGKELFMGVSPGNVTQSNNTEY